MSLAVGRLSALHAYGRWTVDIWRVRRRVVNRLVVFRCSGAVDDKPSRRQGPEPAAGAWRVLPPPGSHRPPTAAIKGPVANDHRSCEHTRRLSGSVKPLSTVLSPVTQPLPPCPPNPPPPPPSSRPTLTLGAFVCLRRINGDVFIADYETAGERYNRAIRAVDSVLERPVLWHDVLWPVCITTCSVTCISVLWTV